MTVYQCLEDSIIAVLQSYIDEDVRIFCFCLLRFRFYWYKNVIFFNSERGPGVCSICCVEQKDESFYTVSWACKTDGTPFLVAGGFNGIIRVIDTACEKIYKVLVTDHALAVYLLKC